MEKNICRPSVVIPCYNVERWVRRCFESVFAALPDGAEIIAVDDGSTDGTLAVLEELSRRGPVKTIARPHAGVSAARNAALDSCSGDVVFFVDPDDETTPDFFTAMLSAMERDGADACICAFKTRDDSTGATREHPLKGNYCFSTPEEIAEKFIPLMFGYTFDDARKWNRGEAIFGRREMATVWRMAFRRDAIERLALRFDETVEYCEDMLFNVRYLLHARKMACVPRALYTATERESGATATVARDWRRLCRNKLGLLAARKKIVEESGGTLARACEASHAFSALEIASCVFRARRSPLEWWRILREYAHDPVVRDSLRRFPLSPRRPFAAAAIAALRVISALPAP